jgi:hypothetical protein
MPVYKGPKSRIKESRGERARVRVRENDDGSEKKRKKKRKSGGVGGAGARETQGEPSFWDLTRVTKARAEGHVSVCRHCVASSSPLWSHVTRARVEIFRGLGPAPFGPWPCIRLTDRSAKSN